MTVTHDENAVGFVERVNTKGKPNLNHSPNLMLTLS